GLSGLIDLSDKCAESQVTCLHVAYEGGEAAPVIAMRMNIGFHGTFLGFLGRVGEVLLNGDLYAVHLAGCSPADVDLLEPAAPILVLQLVDREDLPSFGLGDGKQL